MSDLLALCGSFVALFCAAILVACAFTRLATMGKRRLPPLDAHTPMRLSTLSGVYRARLVTADANGLVLTAPLQRDHYVPIRPGERVSVEAPVPNGVVLFRTTVTERRSEPHEVCLASPKEVHFSDRRHEARDKRWAGFKITLNGHRAELLDVSPHGAKVLCETRVATGELCLLTLPQPLGQARGWALECTPAAFGTSQGTVIRFRFYEALKLPEL